MAGLRSYTWDALLTRRVGQFQVMLSVPALNNPLSPLCGMPHNHILLFLQLHSKAQQPSTTGSCHTKCRESCRARVSQLHGAFALSGAGGCTEKRQVQQRVLSGAQTCMLAGSTDGRFSLPPLSSHEIRKETRFNDSLLKCALPADLTLGRKSVYRINF